MYKDKDKFDYIIIDTKDVLLIDFTLPVEKRLELISTGYNTTINYFKHDLVDKKKKLLPHYLYILKMLLAVKELIKSGKITTARQELNELLANMYEPLEFIDTCFYAEINDFKTKFLEDIRSIMLFNKEILKDSTNSIKNLQSIIDKLTEKYSELVEYINKYEK